MFTLTKQYKTKAMAVNAIRMTATNKGWTALNTEQAAEHVWPQGELFAVNNTTLNEAYGFTSAEDVELATNKASPEVMQAVNAAINEQANKETKTPKLQAPSKLEESKKAAKAAKAAAKPATQEKRETRCNVVNGARRPLRGKTLLVWETTEQMRLDSKDAVCPTLKEVYAELCKKDGGFNKTTASIQYYACKTYNGWNEEK